MDAKAEYFAAFAGRLLRQATTQEVMEVIVDTAVEVVPRCDHASVSYLRGKELVALASSDPAGRRLDEIQTEVQEGPCLDAIRLGVVQDSSDLERDDRWQRYGPRAIAETGVRSSLGLPLHDGNRVIGALNLFSRQVGAIDRSDDASASSALLVAHATPALRASIDRDGLALALVQRDLIGQAKGLLMARSGVDADRAFELLRSASQRMNLKLNEVARRLVAGELGEPPTSSVAAEREPERASSGHP